MCFGSREKDDSGAARSRELDKIIRQDEKRMARQVKLLLLGAFLHLLQIPVCRAPWAFANDGVAATLLAAPYLLPDCRIAQRLHVLHTDLKNKQALESLANLPFSSR